MEEEIEVDIETVDEAGQDGEDSEMPSDDVRWALEENDLDLQPWEPRLDLFTEDG